MFNILTSNRPNQKPEGWEGLTSICSLKSPPNDSEARSSLKTTALEIFSHKSQGDIDEQGMHSPIVEKSARLSGFQF